MKKFIALIIDSDAEPIYAVGREIWRRNAKKHNIEIYFLRADEKITDDSVRVEGDTIHSKWINNFSDRLIDKTLKGFKYCLENTDCQYILRTNLSSFFDIPLFNAYIESIPTIGVYAGPFEYFPLTLPNGISGNFCFCSGAGYLLSRDLVSLILERNLFHPRTFGNDIPIPDDVWMALVLGDMQRSQWVRSDFTDINKNYEGIKLLLRERIWASKNTGLFHYRIKNDANTASRQELDLMVWNLIEEQFLNV